MNSAISHTRGTPKLSGLAFLLIPITNSPNHSTDFSRVKSLAHSGIDVCLLFIRGRVFVCSPPYFMRTLIIGIDSGTQSTKALVVDAQTGKVLASGAQAYELIPDLPPGAKEQHPQTWRDAAGSAMRQALRAARASASEVVAIGVSGQQHGFVPLDSAGEVI